MMTLDPAVDRCLTGRRIARVTSPEKVRLPVTRTCSGPASPLGLSRWICLSLGTGARSSCCWGLERPPVRAAASRAAQGHPPAPGLQCWALPRGFPEHRLGDWGPSARQPFVPASVALSSEQNWAEGLQGCWESAFQNDIGIEA